MLSCLKATFVFSGASKKVQNCRLTHQKLLTVIDHKIAQMNSKPKLKFHDKSKNDLILRRNCEYVSIIIPERESGRNTKQLSPWQPFSTRLSALRPTTHNATKRGKKEKKESMPSKVPFFGAKLQHPNVGQHLRSTTIGVSFP